MEALKDEQDLDTSYRRMRDLQARWKEVALAPPAKGEAMWRRFKTAQDEVFARTAPHVATQAQERTGNLAKKQALCERAEALADSTDWVRTAVALQALQAEWKTIGAAPRGHEKAVWERFRAACDRFFTRRQEDLKHRKEGWAENLARKEALCVQAEALADSTDWDAAATQMRKLQADWKTIGPVRTIEVGCGLAALPHRLRPFLRPLQAPRSARADAKSGAARRNHPRARAAAATG